MLDITNLDYSGILTLLGEYALKIAVAFLIFFIGKWVADRIILVAEKILNHSKIDQTLVNFTINLSKTLFLIFIILAALSHIGIETTSFVAVLGAVSLAIGMAFKDTFLNIGAGVLIVFFKPFKIGDLVELAGELGTATEINLFTTYVKMPNNNILIIPNSQVIGSKIVNYSLTPTRRADLIFSISYDDNIKTAKDSIIEVLSKNDKILKDPLYFVGVDSLGDSSVNLLARFWTKNDDFANACFEVKESVKLIFDEREISIPFPQLHINHKNLQLKL